MVVEQRWPPIYDADDLKKTIRRIVEAPAYEKLLYEQHHTLNSFFQGDVVKLDAPFPLIGPEAEPVLDEPPPYWAVIGNTCDFDRPSSEVPVTQLIPVFELGTMKSLGTDMIRDLRGYHYFTQFFLPAWSDDFSDRIFVADFLRPVTVDKGAFSRATVQARLSYSGWILFHCCLVRFLARDDGRGD